MTLSPARLADYTGRYALTPDIHFVIRIADGKLLGKRDGGAEVELKPEVVDMFFTPGRPRSRRVFRRDAAGRITGFADRREGDDIEWRREP